MIQQSIRNYNERYHSTIKYTPNEIQTHKANLNKVKEHLRKVVSERNIKNYKATRLKHQTKLVKA